MAGDQREALTPNDLYWWYGDQPRARTTMALLMLLDHRPDPQRLRAAALHASEVVPRLRQRVVEAPWSVALPRWEPDPTFDLSYHLRRYSLADDVQEGGGLHGLFRAIGPIYERPFDRTRPLWELIELDLPDDRAGLFFRLHHSIADGVGANAVLAAITDATREGDPRPPTPSRPPGEWPEVDPGGRLVQALRDRANDAERRARGVAGLLRDVAREPSRLVDAGRAVGSVTSDLLRAQAPGSRGGYGRARRLGGVAIPFAPLREARTRLGCRTIELLLTGVAGAMGEWQRQEGQPARTLLTAVPVNLRPPETQGLDSRVGNEVNAMLMHLPIGERDPGRRLEIVRELVAAKRDHPAVGMLPASANVLAVLPRPLHRAVSLAFGGMVELIVTNVPGIPVARFVAGAEIVSAYPIAPVMPHCPLSIALYGYRDHLYVGIDADATAVPDVAPFCELLAASLAEIAGAPHPAPDGPPGG